MKAIALALGAAAALAAAAAAQASEALADKHGCMACHAIERKMVGPAFKDVAAKYRDDKAAAARLLQKVKQGGKGVWGPVPMPPNSHVPDADIEALVKWVLSLK